MMLSIKSSSTSRLIAGSFISTTMSGSLRRKSEIASAVWSLCHRIACSIRCNAVASSRSIGLFELMQFTVNCKQATSRLSPL